MIVSLQEIHWIALHRLWYLIGIITVTLALRLYQSYKRWKAVKLLTGDGRTKDLLIGFSWAREAAKIILIAIGLCSCALALLRPAWGHVTTESQLEGRQVYIALDVSKSMRAEDIQPTRLEASKRKITTLLSKLSCEQVGLILFSGSSFVQCPLTTDYATLKLFLDAVDVESIASGTTALDKAILTATQAFKRSGSKSQNKLLLICTDGEDFSQGAIQAGTKAAQEGIHLITLGVATSEGAPIPLPQPVRGSSYQKDHGGSIVISRLDTQLLTKLAEVTGGTFLQATNDDSYDVSQLKKAIELFEREKLQQDTSPTYIERYWRFVLCAFVSLVLWMLL